MTGESTKVLPRCDGVSPPLRRSAISTSAGDTNCFKRAASTVDYPVGKDPYSVAVGDFNGDDKPDLAVVNFRSNTVSILLGNGNGTFQPAVNVAVGSYPASLAVGDLNGDGKLDLAVSNSAEPPQPGSVSILLGNGDGTFQPQVEYAVGEQYTSIVMADFNSDGKLDLAVLSPRSSNISILLGKGDGAFLPAVTYEVGGIPQSLAVGDFNGDGKPDLAVGNTGNNTELLILLGTGDGAFDPGMTYSLDTGSQWIAVADFNGDGKLDLAVAGTTNLLGRPDTTFRFEMFHRRCRSSLQLPR